MSSAAVQALDCFLGFSPQMAKNEEMGKDVSSPITCKVLCKAKMTCGDIDLKGQLNCSEFLQGKK